MDYLNLTTNEIHPCFPLRIKQTGCHLFRIGCLRTYFRHHRRQSVCMYVCLFVCMRALCLEYIHTQNVARSLINIKCLNSSILYFANASVRTGPHRTTTMHKRFRFLFLFIQNRIQRGHLSAQNAS